MGQFKVYDSYGNLVRSFPTYEQAYNFKHTFGNSNWIIS